MEIINKRKIEWLNNVDRVMTSSFGSSFTLLRDRDLFRTPSNIYDEALLNE